MNLLRLRNILEQNRNRVFVIVWIAVSLLFEFQKHILLPPLGIHQGAQADRASIAFNYARVDMNILKPRVMETGTQDGVTPCEFPLINYTAAVYYRLFGYHPFGYRFIMWCLAAIGTWAVFDLFFRWFRQILPAIILCFTWYSGSILAFYTPGFLPDTASMAFMCLALRQWFINLSNPSVKRIWYFFLFASLAGLIKFTALIFVIAIGIAELTEKLRGRKNGAMLVAAAGVFVPVVLWYLYCKWLERKVGGSYFLMQWVMPSNIDEFKAWFEIYFHNWFKQTYHSAQWILIAAGFVLVGFIRVESRLKTFSLLSLPGVIAFFVLMEGQFRYHDYYIIAMLPFAILPMGAVYEMIRQRAQTLALIMLSAVLVLGLSDAKTGVRLRYTPGNDRYQTFFEPAQFEGVNNWLNKNGVSSGTKILAAFDPNPNNLLYFLQRRGYRTFDHSETYMLEKLNQTVATITDDTGRFFSMYPNTRNRLVYKSSLNRWILYQNKTYGTGTP